MIEFILMLHGWFDPMGQQNPLLGRLKVIRVVVFGIRANPLAALCTADNHPREVLER
jgi:hypothetical protein